MTPVKPGGLALVAVLAIIATLMLLIAGNDLANPSPILPANSIGFAQAIMFLLGYGILGLSPQPPFILAGVYTVIAFGLLLAARWAWILTLLVSFLNLGLNVAQTVALWNDGGPAGWYYLAITSVIIYYLTRPRIRQYFRNG